ncbi:TetR/AcrR family transcriptional regulator [Umezawaea endophytica]|uniref:TetR family transcriptional regulator n=1 Tax=Umezawaea endophytica TaxID=1654476 RepID=A0A9X3ACN5_9PSEU|nr:TetR family transcriptional regulator [Umezawaea endophytica]MCS7475247.1 TetR family transcriptional regulator [Umezawaea endophytica]
MSSPAARRGLEVRRRLLAAAVELVPERGWAGVSTRVLAERAGVTPSVVHYHYPTLRALLTEAVVGHVRQALGEVEAFLATASTPEDAVDALIASVERYTGSDPTSLLLTESYLAATRDEELRERLGGAVVEFRLRFGAWLGERGVPDPERTAAVLIAAVDGLLLHRGLGAAPDSAAVLRRLVDRGGRA